MRPEDLGIGKLFERVRDAVIVADAKTQRIVLWNPAATDVFGYTASEALAGIRVEGLVPGCLKGRHRKGMARYGEKGSGPLIDARAVLDLPAIGKDGEEIAIELSLNPIGEENGEGGGERYVLAILRDVTERKRAERGLRESEERLRVFAEAAFEGIVVSEGCEVLEANPAFLEMFGCEGEEVAGRSVLEFVAPEHRDFARGKVQEGCEEPYELSGLGANGARLQLEVNCRELSYRGRSALVTAIRDVTERKRAEGEIRRLNEELEERVAERTAELLESRSRLKELVGKLVAAQEEERRRVAYEVHDGLTQVAIAALQRLEHFADEHQPGSTVREGELDAALDLVRRTVRESRHVIEGLRPTVLDDFGLSAAIRMRIEELRKEGWTVEYAHSLGKERLDAEIETVLYRVAMEALTNAKKHARAKGARVSLGRSKGRVRLEVADEGRGFEPSEASGEVGPGERVGLTSMRERVALLGGKLEISSARGAGTSVTAEVPLPAPRDGASLDRKQER